MAASHREPPLRRLTQGLASQGLSSLSNFALVVMVARTTSPEVFGAFAIAYSLSLLLTGVLRGVIGEALAVTLANRQVSRESTSPALGAAVVVGITGGLVFAIAGALWPHDLLGRWLLLFAVAVPLLVFQDAVRFVGFAAHRPSVAILSDGVWLGLQLLAWLALATFSELTGEGLLITWWLAAGTAGAVLLRAIGPPAIPSGIKWLAENRRLSLSFGAEYLLHSGTVQAAVYAVGFVAGLPAAGSLRAAESLFGPVRSAGAGLSAVALPQAIRRLSEQGIEVLRRFAYLVASAGSGLAILALVVLWTLPDDLGRSLLGETWPTASTVIPAVGIAMVGTMATIGARLGLRALHEVKASLRLRALTGALTLLLGSGGAVVGGLAVAAWGLAISHTLSALLGWWLFMHKSRGAS